jgi:hypothetical protein
MTLGFPRIPISISIKAISIVSGLMNRHEPASLAAVTKHGNPALPDLGYEPTESYSRYPRRKFLLPTNEVPHHC